MYHTITSPHRSRTRTHIHTRTSRLHTSQPTHLYHISPVAHGLLISGLVVLSTGLLVFLSSKPSLPLPSLGLAPRIRYIPISSRPAHVRCCTLPLSPATVARETLYSVNVCLVYLRDLVALR
ncbi:hypothetical protein K466DRAFT_335975 [Polyporus arcularius HHB13444]|uniref:Uncharacterized protein n=1 Tax=Polyporus arcularius HHB13444 TaxID=1314778 RepID=A0A5C3NYT8_9APHY|nr:hypothetical protein K466DRAFT_335975 [Polyporus arcularius HHB13444]